MQGILGGVLSVPPIALFRPLANESILGFQLIWMSQLEVHGGVIQDTTFAVLPKVMDRKIVGQFPKTKACARGINKRCAIHFRALSPCHKQIG